LLLNKSEIRKLQSKLREKGLTIVPTRMWIAETGFAKIEIALAKGKKSFDKREDIKKRDSDRELKRSEI
jgi:SsrA-binding protein